MKHLRALLFLAALAGCAAPAAHAPAPRIPARRIVSLVPSLTEDLCAIGAAHQLAGVSEFSGDIACATGLPRVNNFSSLDAEKIVRLHPDAVVGIPAQRGMARPLQRAGVPVVLMADDTFADLFNDIAQLGRLSGHRGQARALTAALHRKTAQLQAAEHFRRAPSVFFVEQASPLWTVGPHSYIASLVRLAGGRLATQALRQPYAQYGTESLARLDPDAIVASGDAHLDAVLAREPWRSLRAVREGHVFVLRDAALLVRPGPRYNQGLAWLIERLRPLAESAQ